MSKIAFVFPGQGSQYVGMGAELAQQSQAAQHIFAQADEALGFSLSRLCFEGPEEELRLTVHTQPAILTTSVAVLAAIQEAVPGFTPAYVAGHSLGEYSALVAAEAIPFADAVRTVRSRGQFMEAAVPAGQGAMAAVLGLEREKLQAVCEEVSSQGEPVQLANLNSPGQIVISGSAAGVKLAGEQAKQQGAKRVLPLNVSGPFHSSLMEPAAVQLAEVLAGITLSDAKLPVVANVTARPVMQAADIKQSLIDQVASPVLWEDSVRYMLAEGVTTFVEVGPGKVLSGLIKKIADKEVQLHNVEDAKTLANLLDGGVLC